MTKNGADNKSGLLRQAVPLVGIPLIVASSAPWWFNALFSGKKHETVQVVAAPAPIVERQLLDANVTLSDGLEADVREWLRNDPAYIALANQCIQLLAGKRVIDVIPLDVIASEYKKQFGYGYGQYLPASKFGDQEKLRIAILNTWNGRYPDNKKNNYDDLVQRRP